jgi:fluoride exporter
MEEEPMVSSNDNASGWPTDPDLGPDEIGERDSSSEQRRRARHVQFVIVVAIACGGVVGSVSRYLLSLALPTETGRFPWGTFLINVTGSALLGFLLVLLMEQFPRGHLARPALGTGIIGAYTTFSTFVVEAVLLVRDGQVLSALTYVLLSVLVGIGALWIGMTGARLAMRTERWLGEELQ